VPTRILQEIFSAEKKKSHSNWWLECNCDKTCSSQPPVKHQEPRCQEPNKGGKIIKIKTGY